MANYLENTWEKLSGLFSQFPTQDEMEKDYYDPMKKSLMGFATNAGDFMSSALGGEPVRVIDKSRPATTEYVVPNQEPLDVQLRQGYAESIVPQDRGNIDITDIQAQERTNDVISNMGYMTPQQMQAEKTARQPVKTADEVKDEMESTLTDNTMQNLKTQDDLNAQMSGAEATQKMMEQNFDMNQPPKGVMDFVSKQGGSAQDAISLLSMADAGAITQDNANAIVKQVSANATPDQMNASLEDALERADTDRQIMEAEYDFNKDMQGGMNIADKVEAGEIEPSFWDKTKKFLADEETMLTLAQSFNTMRLEPDDALGKSIDKRLETIRKTKKTSSTVSLVRAKAMSETDPIKKQKLLNTALMMEQDPSKSSTYFAQISDLMAGGVDKESWERGWKITQAFYKDKNVADFSEQDTAFRRILDSAIEPSQAGDLALIFNFMKVLDPGSTVREGEFANAENSAKVSERVRGQYNKLLTDEGRLSEAQRLDFVDRARRIYSGSADKYVETRNRYYKDAQNSGVNADEIVRDIYNENRQYIDPKITYEMLTEEDKKKVSPEEFDKFIKDMKYLEKATMLMRYNKLNAGAKK